MATTALKVDAGNRSLRTLLVGLVVNVIVAVATLVVTMFVGKTGWGDFQWSIVSFSLVQTVLTAAGSYILRVFLDPSGFPTPLPPAPQVPPADPAAIPKAEQDHGL